MAWRDYVDPLIRNHLERQIGESIKNRGAYDDAENPGNAQLWVAIANLSKEIFDLNLKIKYFEGALKAVGKKEIKKKSSKKEIDDKH